MTRQKAKMPRAIKTPPEQSSFFSRLHISPTHLREISGVFLFLIGGITLLTLLRVTSGTVGDLWANVIRAMFGWGAFALPVFVIGAGAFLLRRGDAVDLQVSWGRIFAAEIFFAVIIALLHMFTPAANAGALALGGEGGGFVGYAISRGLALLIGDTATRIVLILMGLLTLPAIAGLSADRLYAWSGALSARAEQTKTAPRRLSNPEKLESEREPAFPPPKPRTTPFVQPSTKPPAEAVQLPLTKPPEELPLRPVFGSKPPQKVSVPQPILTPRTGTRRRVPQLPSIDLLDAANEAKYSQDEAHRQGATIVETLANFGVPVELLEEEIRVGPTITQFGLKPGFVQVRSSDGKTQQRKVPVNRIVALQHDLELALARAPIRIEAPVPGRPIVGVEVPNQAVSVVSLRGVLDSEVFRSKKKKSALAIALGRDVSGAPQVADLGAMPHLLIAGATGSGKSVCINAIVACLLFNNSPDDLRMIMIDPKRVELVNFNGIPHLLGPVVVKTHKEDNEAVQCLQWLVREMDQRFSLFAKEKVRNIDAFNAKMEKEGGATMPYIVALIDELADLMLSAQEETEKLLTRLAQMARATGIHLVIATQRPSVDVVTGLIKANFPSRISFAVTSSVDSRVVLDTPGAEKLLGKGDMLYMANDSSMLFRLQGCFVSDDELARLVNFWREKAITDMREIVHEPPWKGNGSAKESPDDTLIEQAIELASQLDHLSISLLQRKLGIGYPRAARLMDQLEERGVVSHDDDGGKGRIVLHPEPAKPAAKKKK
jgi:S-DNA-T family DNA segregation ATPase FtsK/SpoIIIE